MGLVGGEEWGCGLTVRNMLFPLYIYFINRVCFKAPVVLYGEPGGEEWGVGGDLWGRPGLGISGGALWGIHISSLHPCFPVLFLRW